MTNINLEQIARDNIDRPLILCGCVIQDKQRIISVSVLMLMTLTQSALASCIYFL